MPALDGFAGRALILGAATPEVLDRIGIKPTQQLGSACRAIRRH